MARAWAMAGCDKYGPDSRTIQQKGITTDMRDKKPKMAEDLAAQLCHRRSTADKHYFMADKIKQSARTVHEIITTLDMAMDEPTAEHEEVDWDDQKEVPKEEMRRRLGAMRNPWEVFTTSGPSERLPPLPDCLRPTATVTYGSAADDTVEDLPARLEPTATVMSCSAADDVSDDLPALPTVTATASPTAASTSEPSLKEVMFRRRLHEDKEPKQSERAATEDKGRQRTKRQQLDSAAKDLILRDFQTFVDRRVQPSMAEVRSLRREGYSYLSAKQVYDKVLR